MAPFSSLPWLAPREPAAWCRTALSQEASLEAAVDAVVRQLNAPEAADLALVFVSSAYASDLPRLLPLLSQRLRASHWMGCVGGGVVGTDAGGVPRSWSAKPPTERHPAAAAGRRAPPLPDRHHGPARPGRSGEAWSERVGAPAASGMLLLVDPSTRHQ